MSRTSQPRNLRVCVSGLFSCGVWGTYDVTRGMIHVLEIREKNVEQWDDRTIPHRRDDGPADQDGDQTALHKQVDDDAVDVDGVPTTRARLK